MFRIIAHVDMDAFFAAIEEREHPAWKGKPVVVGADPEAGRGRGVVSTANYAARKFGIRSAMPISLAWRKCHYAMFVRPRRLYGEVSRKIMVLLAAEAHRVDGKVEVVSVDEAYLDLSALKEFIAAETFCKGLKAKILGEERLTASIGIGPNKFVAKIASDFQKPDGLTKVLPESVEAFLEPLAVRALRGVGPKAEEHLRRLGIQTVRDLRQRTEEDLIEAFGVFGRALFRQARGIDDRDVTEKADPVKSIGRQTTFPADIVKAGLILAAAIKLAEKVHRDVLTEGVQFQTVTVTCRYAGFETHTKSRTLPAPTKSFSTLKVEVMKLLWPFLPRTFSRHDAVSGGQRNSEKVRGLGRRPVRLVGVRVGKLDLGRAA